MLVLSILHNIFISELHSKLLNEGECVDLIGVSLPVWSYRGNTSEPAEEVFCKYRLTNDPNRPPIEIKPNGYVINMPQLPENVQLPSLSNEAWRAMSKEERDKYYENRQIFPSAKNLIPPPEGAGYLHFQEVNKIRKNKKTTMLFNIVEIKTMDLLLNSLS